METAHADTLRRKQSSVYNVDGRVIRVVGVIISFEFFSLQFLCLWSSSLVPWVLVVAA